VSEYDDDQGDAWSALCPRCAGRIVFMDDSVIADSRRLGNSWITRGDLRLVAQQDIARSK
jgi:hypothetical protein